MKGLSYLTGSESEQLSSKDVWQDVRAVVAREVLYNREDYEGVSQDNEATVDSLSTAILGEVMRTRSTLNVSEGEDLRLKDLMRIGQVGEIVNSYRSAQKQIGPHVMATRIDSKGDPIENHKDYTLVSHISNFQAMKEFTPRARQRHGFGLPQVNPRLSRVIML